MNNQYNIYENNLINKSNNTERKLVNEKFNQAKDGINTGIIARNFNDAVFYKHTIKTTKEEVRKFVAITRYDLAATKTREAKELLDSYIYY